MVQTLKQPLIRYSLEENRKRDDLLDDTICAYRVRKAADVCSLYWLIYGIQPLQVNRYILYLNQTSLNINVRVSHLERAIHIERAVILLGNYLDRAKRVVSTHLICKSPFLVGEKVLVHQSNHENYAQHPEWMSSCKMAAIRGSRCWMINE